MGTAGPPGQQIAGARLRYDADRDAWLVHRPARTWPAVPPVEAPRLPPPPEVPDPAGSSALTAALPLLGSLGIVAFALVVRSLVYLLVAAFMVTAIVGGTVATRVLARRRERRRRARVRRDYTARVAEARSRSVAAAAVARDALAGLYPDTAGLLTAVRTYGALWERRTGDRDFAHVRLGLGRVAAPAPVTLEVSQSPPGTAHEPDLAAAAERAVSETAYLDEAPVVLRLRELSSVVVVGDPARGRDLAGAWLTTLAATCAPTDLRVMGLVPPSAAPAWEWAKWLPHVRDPLAGDGFGRAARAVSTDQDGFASALRDLVTTRLEQERRAADAGGWSRAAGAPVVAAEHVVVLVDDYDPVRLAALAPALEVLLVRGADLAVTVLLLVDDAAAAPSSVGGRVDLRPDGLARFRAAGPDAIPQDDVLADSVDREAAEELARLLAPLHLADADADSDLVDTVRLVELLGYESFEQVEPHDDWLRVETLVRTTPDPAAANADDAVGVPDDGTAPAAGRRPEDLLATPVGIRSDGSRLVLDLKEAAAGGMGPHGMLVGATGSGKSELLRSLVAGLAAGHDPDLLNVLLVDFKGGAAFAELEGLPHTTGLITNLADDLSLIDRMRTSLGGELERRQQLLRDAGKIESIRSYHELRAQRPELPSLPYLLVVVDEFGELLAARPEFIEVFVAIGRLGRSLGVHLLLATQRLEEGRIRGLESHLRYRICLRTYSGAESTTVIGVPDAYALPPLPGLGYLRVDAELVRFKAATTSLAHRPVQRSGRVPAVVRPFVLDRGQVGVAAGSVAPAVDAGAHSGTPVDRAAGVGPVRTELHALVERLAGSTSTGPHRVWLPPLPDVVPLEDVPVPFGRHRSPTGPPVVAVGLLDDPARQSQQALQLDLSGGGGHVACVGSPRTGKTTFLRTLVESLVEGSSPADVAIYLLDLGGGGLTDLEKVAHVGAVAGRHDPDAVGRLVREMRAVVDERAAAFRACGVSSLQDLRRHPRAATVLPDPLAAEVFLLVDNIGVLRNEFTELDLALADLASTSLQFGVHVVVTAGRWLDVRPALLDAIGNRIELHLNDPVDSLAGRRLAEGVPADRPGRGILRDGRHVQIALPPDRPQRIDQPEWPVRAPRVRPLPARLTVDDVPDLAAAAGRPVADQQGLLLGVGEFRLAPQLVDVTAPGAHLLVYGDEGSGRTTLLSRAVDHLDATTDPEQVRVHLVDLGRGLLDRADLPAVEHYAFTASLAEAMTHDLLKELLERLPPPDLDRTTLLERSWWSGPEHVVVVDDYELTLAGPQGPLSAMAEAIPYARDIGLHVVLARRVAGASRSAFEPFGQRLRELTPTALLLDGERSEGPLVGERAATRQPPGRGLLVRRGAADTLVQLAMPALADAS